MRVLRVTSPFGDYSHGDEIRDPDLIAKFEASHHAYLVAVIIPDEPEPAKPVFTPSPVLAASPASEAKPT